MTERAHTVLWVVGEPGVGKTTFCRKLLATRGGIAGAPIANWSEFHDGAAVGSWLGNAFDGGDRVPPSGILPALQYYRDHFTDRKLVLFDGDKFANFNAVQLVMKAVREAGRFADTRLVCVHIVGPTSAAAGRTARVAAGARPQNESWVRGRRTKSSRFVEYACYSCGVEVIKIDRDKGESWD